MTTLITGHLEVICNLHVQLQRLNLFPVQGNSQSTLLRTFIALPPDVGFQNRKTTRSRRKSYVDYTATMMTLAVRRVGIRHARPVI